MVNKRLLRCLLPTLPIRTPAAVGQRLWIYVCTESGTRLLQCEQSLTNHFQLRFQIYPPACSA